MAVKMSLHASLSLIGQTGERTRVMKRQILHPKVTRWISIEIAEVVLTLSVATSLRGLPFGIRFRHRAKPRRGRLEGRSRCEMKESG